MVEIAVSLAPTNISRDKAEGKGGGGGWGKVARFTPGVAADNAGVAAARYQGFHCAFGGGVSGHVAGVLL